ncbi:hypothetical protein [Bordetella sp. FB-8]|uniref:hypothetical protein n=1 Tax=Bordetella sp. FB-8 TaxID=1159870 RepID=UPI0012DC8019|nr:hypothetical protein [Bordetella sp. FB-8]
MLRLVAAFNGVAALLLTSFSLGIVGGDTDSPDLSQPLGCFLFGLAACCLALLLMFATQLRCARGERESRPPRVRLGLTLAALAFASGVAGFAMGCWSACSIDTSDNGQASNTLTVYAGTPSVHFEDKKVAFYR